MSSNKSDYIVLALLGALIALIVLLAAIVGGSPDSHRGDPWFRTTQSSNVDGMLVYYTALERLGIPVQRTEKMLTNQTLSGMQALFLIDPVIPVVREEREALARWVADGGVLVCTSELDDPVGSLRDDPIASLGQVGPLALQDVGGDAPTKSTGVPDDAADLPLARDVRRLMFASNRVLDLPETDDAVLPLLEDDTGVRIASKRIGEGLAVVLSDSSLLANGRIGKAENALAAVNLACFVRAKAGDASIAFDEYHFGFGTHGTSMSVLTDLLFRTSPGWGILCLSCAAVLFMVYKGRRFGTRRGLDTRRRRSKLEYIASVAGTFRRAKADGLVLEIIFQRFRRDASQFVGTPVSAPIEELASALSRRFGGSPERYLAPMRRCVEAMGGSYLSERRMLALLSQIANIESEIVNATSGRNAGGRADHR